MGGRRDPREVREATGPAPADEVCAIVKQIADAVHAAHAVGIVHRDLKPENVMYDPATRQVKLLDFGIATDTDMAPEQRLTRAGFFVGTLMYVAPEALSGELVGPLADQYSLATIAYFLLTGCLPFPAKTPREMFSQLLSQPPIPLNQAKPGLALLARRRNGRDARAEQGAGKRYSDVVAFATEIRKALERPPRRRRGRALGAKIAVALPQEVSRATVIRPQRSARSLPRRRPRVEIGRDAPGSHTVNVEPLPS